MKIYVAARLHDKDKVLDLHGKLQQLGHEVTHDWTIHKNILPYCDNLTLAETYAQNDLQGVKNAEACIFLTNEEIGAGSSTELGAAIMLNLISGRPDIYVVGRHIEKNLFYYHSVVKRLENIEEVLESLNTVQLEKEVSE